MVIGNYVIGNTIHRYVTSLLQKVHFVIFTEVRQEDRVKIDEEEEEAGVLSLNQIIRKASFCLLSLFTTSIRVSAEKKGNS